MKGKEKEEEEKKVEKGRVLGRGRGGEEERNKKL